MNHSRTEIKVLMTNAGNCWSVGETGLFRDAEVTEIYEVFHKSVPMYRVNYSNGYWFEIPVTSVEFVRGGE